MRELDIWQQVQRWLLQAQSVWLCTVLETWGSAPRPSGSLLACTSQGGVIGSLSGGCVEEDLLARIAAGDFAQPVTRHTYGASPEEAERLRLPCGGVLEIVIAQWLPDTATLSVVAQLIEALQVRRRIRLTCDFLSGIKQALPAQPGAPVIEAVCGSNSDLLALHHVLGPPWRLLLLGAGEVSRAVAQMALLMDYEVLVCEPREDMRLRWDLSQTTLIPSMPDDATLQCGDDPYCAVLALSHDPRIDDMGLMVAFSTQAFYIGAMGSQRTSEKRRERLAALGVTAEQLSRLHAPVGLATGSRTPAEIAVSTLAEITAVRRKSVS